MTFPRNDAHADDYEILGAFEILADDNASPVMKSEARALLRNQAGGSIDGKTEVPQQARLLRQPWGAKGLVTDRPRAVLPGPREVLIRPGEVVDVQLRPQRVMRGPYWLGVTQAAHLVVTDLTFGNQCAFDAPGEVPGKFFDVEDIEHLIAIAGAPLSPGYSVRVGLRNVSACTLGVSLCLWGNDVDSVDMADRLEASGALQRQPDENVWQARALELEGQVWEWERRTAALVAVLQRESESSRRLEAERMRDRDLLIPSVAAERDRRVDHERRRDLDASASAAHALTGSFEPGDIWETPTDES